MIDIKKILVPTDFSEYSRKSIKYGISLAEQYNAEVYVLYVFDDRIFDESLFILYTENEMRQNRKKVYNEQLEKIVCDIHSKSPQLELHRKLKVGIAFVEIIKFAKAENIDLIIMSSHGRTGISHLLIGSTTEKVVRKAPCPVLTVRPKEHEFVHP